jgi:hypothetical protein
MVDRIVEAFVRPVRHAWHTVCFRNVGRRLCRGREVFQCFRQLSLPQFRYTLSRALDCPAGGCQRIDCSGLPEASYGIDVTPLFQRDETVA